jgi:serine/threonine protein kinase
VTNRSGQQLGNYTLTRLLGQGGFAEVYLGEHVYLKVPAAIKVLHTQLSDQDDIESFLREAQFVARLAHPNIVRVLDFGIVDQVPFLVMDYAQNGTLRQRYPRGTRLPLTAVVSYVKQVASALQYAHDERLIHRDIKPENMLLGRRDEVLLSDFGIALVAQSSKYQNEEDVVGGTAAYMSPEQIQGKSRPASDQYALAIVVYEWLTGERPFRGSFTEICSQHLFAPVPSIREKLPDIPAHVEQVITTALAKDAKQRFGSVQAFANALEQASQEYKPPVSASQAETRYPVASPQPPSIVPLASQQTPQAPLAQQPPSVMPAVQQQQTPTSSPSPPLLPTALVETEEQPPLRSAAEPEKRPGRWSLGKSQFIAILVGFVLYSVTEYLFSVTASNGDSANQSLLLCLLSILIAIIFIVGTKFGPWVGFIVPFAGSLAPERLLIHNSITSTLPYSLLVASSGFVAGLAFVATRGNYRSGKSIGLAILTSILGVAVACIGDSIVESGANITLIIESGIIALVLLPFALLLANRFGKPADQQAKQ